MATPSKMLYGMICKQVVLFSKYFFYDTVTADRYLHVPPRRITSVYPKNQQQF
jgi:hypothetical protein